MPFRVGRSWLRLWSILALANLLAAIVLTLQPERAMPLLTIRSWTADWLLRGTNVYVFPQSNVDYPPHAIVALSPLALMPASVVVGTWALFNIVLAIVAPILVARFVAPQARRHTVACFVLLFLCWSGTKTLLQVSLLTLVLGLTAALWAERRPGLAGIALGLALMKPQISVPVFLWMLLTRRWTVVAGSIATIAVGYAAFCLRAHAGPAAVVAGHIAVLRRYYLGDYAMEGESHLRPLLSPLVRPDGTDWLTGVVAVALLVVVLFMGLRQVRRRENPLLAAPALAGVWSLLTFYFLTYGFVLILPAAALLFFDSSPTNRTPRQVLFWTLQIGLMADVPGIWRRLAALNVVSFSGGGLAPHFDRLLMLTLFASLVALYWRAGSGTTAVK